MAQAGLAYITPRFEPEGPAANDQPPQTRDDLWLGLINGFKKLNLPALAIYCTKAKLRGDDPWEFCQLSLDIFGDMDRVADNKKRRGKR